LGNGDGTFQAPLTLTLSGLHPEAVAAADLDGDGKTDLAVVMVGTPGQPATLAVFLGQAGGGFQPARTFPLQATGGTASGVAIGDLNGDGKPDIAAVSNFGQQIDVLLGDGRGGFSEAAQIPQSIESGADGRIMSDLDGDGNLDLTIPHCCGQADGTFLRGNGDGTFQAEQQFLSGSSPTGVAVTKLSGNTRLVSVDRGGTLVAVALATPVAVATNVSSATANGTYGAGSSISIQINFSRAVTVTGTPQLALNSGRDGQLQFRVGHHHADLYVYRGRATTARISTTPQLAR
jgi:hypothetical protein